MQKFNNRKTYRDFVTKRDYFLEQILIKSQQRISDFSTKAFNQMMLLVNANYDRILIQHNKKLALKHFDESLQHVLDELSNNIVRELLALRRKTYLFTYASEHRAIQDQRGLNTRPKVDQLDLNAAITKNFADEINPVHKIDHELVKLKRNFLSKFELAIIQARPIKEALGMCFLALPKQRPTSKRKSLKNIKATEAGYKKRTAAGLIDSPLPENDLSIGLAINVDNSVVKTQDWVFDPETWKELIKDYKAEHISIDRGPNNIVNLTDPRTGDPFVKEMYDEDQVYAWQIERDITHDFVQQVRDGQVDAANENGIDEFIVIAILDNVVCDSCCGDVGCADFDGLLTSEVEELTKGEQSAPPYHFNCRCALAPASKDAGFIDESESKREFDQWLNDTTIQATTR